MSKIVAFIPARGGSKGLPRKNIKLLAGKPLIAYTIEVAKKSKFIDRIIVSTEDSEISEIVVKYGAEIIDRPKELATDEALVIDAIFHMLNILKNKKRYPDIVIMLQPTSPLRTAIDIDNAIELFLTNECESVVSVYEVSHPPHWSFKIERGYLKPLLGDSYLKMRRQDIEKSYRPNGAIFISNPEKLYQYEGFYCTYTIPYFMPIERSVDIDNELDFLLVELLMKKNKSEKNKS